MSKQSVNAGPKGGPQIGSLAPKTAIIPFWNRLPKFFVYPFHLRVISLIVALSAATALFSRPTLFGALVRIAVWGIFLKYSFEALKETAQGRLLPPKVGLGTINNNFQVVFKQLGVFIVIGFAFVKILGALGVFFGLLFLCLAILSVPAMVILLVVTNSFIKAINPILFGKLAWRIGWGYLLMYLFLALLGIAPAVVGKYIVFLLPEELHLFLISLSEKFYTLVSYHLMGYVLFQYHDAIGYEARLEKTEKLTDETSEDDAREVLEAAEALIQEGKIDEAISLIGRDAEGRISNLDLAKRYYDLLKLKNLTPQMLDHGRRYLEMLSGVDKMEEMHRVYLECASKDRNFTPSAASLFKMARFLNDAGNPKGAVEAYNHLVKRHCGSALIPKAYFLAANIINEKLKNPQKAVKILTGLIKTYPDHEIIPYVQRYLKNVYALSHPK